VLCIEEQEAQIRAEREVVWLEKLVLFECRLVRICAHEKPLNRASKTARKTKREVEDAGGVAGRNEREQYASTSAREVTNDFAN